MKKKTAEIEAVEHLLKRHRFVWVWCQQDRYPRPSGARAYAVGRRTVTIFPNAGGRQNHEHSEEVEHWRIRVNKTRMAQEPPALR